MKKTLVFLFKKPSGQFLTVGVLCVLAAYIGRFVYVDMPKIENEEIAKAGPERLEEMANKLSDALSAADDRSAAVDALPELTAWNPSSLPCATEGKFDAGSTDFWTKVGVKAEAPTVFQYRFERYDAGFVLRARRDADCDGLHVVHTLRAPTDWTSAMRAPVVETENSAE